VLGRADQPGTQSHKSGYDLVPRGLGIPLSYYRNFIEHPSNQKLRDTLDDLIANEKAGKLSSTQRAQQVQQVQTLLLDAKFPQKDLVRIEKKIKKVLPGVKKIKVRSSANAEDIPNFDGAGLYDSFAATVDKNNDGQRCQSRRIRTAAARLSARSSPRRWPAR
jgi:phosphoenolpyruvate synthase/pyruvate phosphate dikinase